MGKKDDLPTTPFVEFTAQISCNLSMNSSSIMAMLSKAVGVAKS